MLFTAPGIVLDITGSCQPLSLVISSHFAQKTIAALFVPMADEGPVGTGEAGKPFRCSLIGGARPDHQGVATMSRLLTVALGVFLLGVGPAPAQPSDKWLPGKLLQPIDFSGFEDVNTRLIEAMDHLGAKFGLAFRINEKAFRAEQIAEVTRFEIANPPIPPIPGTRLKVVLQALLERIPSTSGATYLIRDGYIEITTNEAARNEIWGEKAKGPFFPLVHTPGQDRPLQEVIDDIAVQGPLNVVVDPRVREALAIKVSVRLTNAPADTALDILSEMAGLKTVRLRNVFFITTPERAAELRKEQARS
jgi:hypothetical protein